MINQRYFKRPVLLVLYVIEMSEKVSYINIIVIANIEECVITLCKYFSLLYRNCRSFEYLYAYNCQIIHYFIHDRQISMLVADKLTNLPYYHTLFNITLR